MERRQVDGGPGPHGPLADGEVRVVRVRLDREPYEPAASLGALSAAELRRAARFRRPDDARRWLAGRLVLRRLLGGCLGLAPGAVALADDAHGRPCLPEGCGAGLRFSVAHRDEVAVLAVARGREVGIDVERVRADLAVEEIAQRFFTAEEVGALGGVPAGGRVEAFFRGWTRKEAYLKALGVGLAAPLDAFVVPLAAAACCRLLAHASVPDEVGRWLFFDVPVPAGHLAALAVEEVAALPPPRIEVWDWRPRPPAAPWTGHAAGAAPRQGADGR